MNFHPVHGCVYPGSAGAASVLSEETITTMSPTAAAVSKIVKPGMKLTEVTPQLHCFGDRGLFYVTHFHVTCLLNIYRIHLQRFNCKENGYIKTQYAHSTNV